MSARRVVHVVEALGLGGLERIVVSLVRHADPARYLPYVVCAAGGGPLVAEAERAGAPVEILGLRHYGPTASTRLARRLRALAACVVHSHGHFAGVVGRTAAFLAAVPVVVHHLHTEDTTLRLRHRLAERWLARATTRILACSAAVAKHASEAVGLPGARVQVVPNGIDPPPPGTRDQAAALLGVARGPVVGCVGALARHKGQTTLLKALARLPAPDPVGTLVLVGDGPERPRLEGEARALTGWNVLFLGARGDVRRLLPAFDIAVVPSIEREGFGLTALEAMDAAVPVVASRIGGLVEVVEDGRCGLLVPPGDPEALAEAIRSLLSWPERARRFGLAGRRRVESDYRATPMARRVTDIYEEALHARSAA